MNDESVNINSTFYCSMILLYWNEISCENKKRVSGVKLMLVFDWVNYLSLITYRLSPITHRQLPITHD